MNIYSVFKKKAFLFLALAIMFLSVSGFSHAVTSNPPNFILIVSDDQDWTGLSVQMHPDIPNSKSNFYQTPNLEKLAAQGMRFSSAYAPAPVCSPTRISLQTGKSPAQLHWTKAAPVARASDGYKLIAPIYDKNISRDEITIAEVLSEAGYTTAHYGKWHIGGGGPGEHGYDFHDGNTSNGDAEPFVDPNPVDIFGMTNRAIELMKESTVSKKPFFIQLSYHALHYPENALKSTLKSYQERYPDRDERSIQRAALAENLDTGVGMLIDHIDASGLAANTFIIYMSDNGAGGRTKGRPLTGGKGSLGEGGLRVPFVVRGPDVNQNTFSQVPIVGYDLYPTFCTLAGIESPLAKGIEGGDISALFSSGEGVVKRPREELVFHFPHYQSKVAPHSTIRVGDLKLFKYYETGNVYLYDLESDIREENDLTSSMPEKTSELHAKLNAYLTAIDAQLPSPNPDYDPNVEPSEPGGSKRGKKGGKGGKRATNQNKAKINHAKTP